MGIFAGLTNSKNLFIIELWIIKAVSIGIWLDKTNFDDVMNTAKKYTTKAHNELDLSALIYLFGSVVHGNIHSRSDVDVDFVSGTFTNDVAETIQRQIIWILG